MFFSEVIIIKTFKPIKSKRYWPPISISYFFSKASFSVYAISWPLLVLHLGCYGTRFHFIFIESLICIRLLRILVGHLVERLNSEFNSFVYMFLHILCLVVFLLQYYYSFRTMKRLFYAVYIQLVYRRFKVTTNYDSM